MSGSVVVVQQQTAVVPESFESQFSAHENIVDLAGVSEACYDIMPLWQKELVDTCRSICDKHGITWRK